MKKRVSQMDQRMLDPAFSPERISVASPSLRHVVRATPQSPTMTSGLYRPQNPLPQSVVDQYHKLNSGANISEGGHSSGPAGPQADDVSSSKVSSFCNVPLEQQKPLNFGGSPSKLGAGEEIFSVQLNYPSPRASTAGEQRCASTS